MQCSQSPYVWDRTERSIARNARSGGLNTGGTTEIRPSGALTTNHANDVGERPVVRAQGLGSHPPPEGRLNAIELLGDAGGGLVLPSQLRVLTPELSGLRLEMDQLVTYMEEFSL